MTLSYSRKSLETIAPLLFSQVIEILKVWWKRRSSMKYGLKFEIWGFNRSVNKTAKQNSGEIQVFAIDDIFAEISFNNMVWGDQIIPRERSLLVS